MFAFYEFMENCSLKKKTVNGLVWSSIEKFSVQGIQLLVMLVIARILEPEDFGLIGMLALFIAVSESLINSGFSQALIRKQGRTEVDNSTVFFFNIVASLILYLILFLSSPLVAYFYEEPRLISLMRVLCLIIIVNSFGVVQRVIYTSNVDFKTQARASFIAVVFSGAISIYCARKGLGVWSLVIQQLLNASISVLFLWLYSKWIPKLVFSWASFKEMFGFGSKLMVSGLIDTIYSNIHSLVIGKVFNSKSLGYYTQARNFSLLPSSSLTDILKRVSYPVLCTLQESEVELKKNYRKLLRISAYIIFPLMCGIASVSYPLIDLILGEKWHCTAQLIIPLCFSTMWYPIHAINLNLLQVKGRSDLFLKLEIIKKVQGITILVLSIPFGLVFMCYSTIASSLIALVINTYYTGKLINVGFVLQMKDIAGSLFASLTMFVVVYISLFMFENNIIKLLAGVLIGICYYFGITYFMKFEELDYIKSTIWK